MATNRIIRLVIPLVGSVCLFSPFYFKLEQFPSTHLPVNDPAPRRLDIVVDDTDEMVTAKLSVVSKSPASDVTFGDHKRITSMLDDARELMEKARGLLKDENSGAQAVVDAATKKFKEAKDYILEQRKLSKEAQGEEDFEDVERKTLAEDGEEEAVGEDLDLDLSRSVFETDYSFPECVHRTLEFCLDWINEDLANLGLSTIELLIHEKRNINQDGYNKVVIVTNDDASLVTGRLGDGIVTYPFTWDDAVSGTRTLGVDGKWNCQGKDPQTCCDDIKQSAENPDTKGNYLECHIFVPFGGVGNAKRDDRVIINLSPDGRVHEEPQIE